MDHICSDVPQKPEDDNWKTFDIFTQAKRRPLPSVFCVFTEVYLSSDYRNPSSAVLFSRNSADKWEKVEEQPFHESQQGLHLPAEHPSKAVSRPGTRQDYLQGPDEHQGGV